MQSRTWKGVGLANQPFKSAIEHSKTNERKTGAQATRARKKKRHKAAK